MRRLRPGALLSLSVLGKAERAEVCPRAAGGKHCADGLWLSTMQAPYLLLDSVSVLLVHRIFFIGLMSLWRCLRKEREWMRSEGTYLSKCRSSGEP